MPLAAINGLNLYYEEAGSGPPLLLIAGLSGTTLGWAMLLPALAAHFRVITFDNRGAGRSSAPPGPYTTRQMADDAAALLEHLGIDAGARASASRSGGMIAQELALNSSGARRSLGPLRDLCAAAADHPRSLVYELGASVCTWGYTRPTGDVVAAVVPDPGVHGAPRPGRGRHRRMGGRSLPSSCPWGRRPGGRLPIARYTRPPGTDRRPDAGPGRRRSK